MANVWEWITGFVSGIIRFVDDHPKTTLIVFVVLLSALTFMMWG